MEHQSAIAYGNAFKKGYQGNDLSGSGWGKKWDFIIIHESGHEWFGNNITTNDIADMWVHEGFTAYSETIYTTCMYGVEAGNDYVIGTRTNIRNDRAVIGAYGVNQEGSGDMYYKGANMLHTIRQLFTDDDSFREMLVAMNSKFYHSTITSEKIEKFISDASGRDLSKIFDQYLRTVMIPVLEFDTSGSALSYRYTNVVEGFDLPVKTVDGLWLYPTKDWQMLDNASEGIPAIDRNFYIEVKTGNS
jgi:aminopeptidase N